MKKSKKSETDKTGEKFWLDTLILHLYIYRGGRAQSTDGAFENYTKPN